MESKLKIIGILAFPHEHSGGIFQYTQSMIDALKDDTNNKYVIFCFHHDNRFDHYGLEVRKIDDCNFPLYKKILRNFILGLIIPGYFHITQKEKRLFSDVDIYISPNVSPYPHYYLNKPFIFTLHDMQERYYPQYFTFKERIIRHISNNFLSKRAIGIICESNYVKNDIVKFTNANIDDVYVIPAPPPQRLMNFSFTEEKLLIVKNKYNLPDQYIFYPAQYWHHKNHIKLVEAFDIVSKKFKHLNLIFTGAHHNNYKILEEKINQLNLINKIKHLGFIDYDELPYLYKMSRMLILPTLFESVSIPIYEAFALKIPVCSSNVTALPEQIGDAGLTFNPFDINDMAEKIIMYLENTTLANKKARLGFEKLNNFNHSEYKKNLLDILNKY